MKQFFIVLTFVLTMFSSAPSYATENEHYSTLFVLTDVIIYRPLGVVTTVVGAAVFVAISPFTALAQIAPPHDAFEKTSDILIMAPGRYTFVRPVGDMSVSKY